MNHEQEYNAALEQAKKELKTCGSMNCNAARLIFRLFPQLRKEEAPLTPFQQWLNCILRGVYYAEVPDEKVNEFILNVVRTRTDELIKLAKKHEYTDCQLRESEDEKIRKRLLWFLDNYTGSWDYPETKAACRAWLEKQKELFKSGRGVYYYDGEKTTYCAVVTEDNPNDFAMSQQEKQKEQEHDEGDFTIYHPRKNGKGEYECIPYSFYGSLTSFSEDKDLIDFLRTCFYTKEECNEWIEQQKEQKPAEWSEEDEAMRDNILRVLSCFIGNVECESNPSLSTSYPLYKREMDWLKSLRPSWKPSEEQMEELNKVRTLNPGLDALYQQLKNM